MFLQVVEKRKKIESVCRYKEYIHTKRTIESKRNERNELTMALSNNKTTLDTLKRQADKDIRNAEEIKRQADQNIRNAEEIKRRVDEIIHKAEEKKKIEEENKKLEEENKKIEEENKKLKEENKKLKEENKKLEEEANTKQKAQLATRTETRTKKFDLYA